MDAYFHGPFFPRDLALLHTTAPSSLTREHALGGDASAVFFGGSGWKGVASDLAGIPPPTRPHFVLSLFMVVVTDQCLHAHFPAAQRAWRARTGFPLFGWSGTGIHNENPYHLCAAPVAAGLVDEAAAVALVPALAALFHAEVTSHLAGLSIDAADFFAALRADATYGPATQGRVGGQSGAGCAADGAATASAAEPAGAALVRAVALALGQA
jgi:hypothetical protein